MLTVIMSKYTKGDIVVVEYPLRFYKITGEDINGYHGTYIGPGAQTADNALVLISYNVVHRTRLATPAEITLYTLKPHVFKIF